MSPSGAVVASGLLEALARVPDPRNPRGVRFQLATLLAVGMCALTSAGHNSLTAHVTGRQGAWSVRSAGGGRLPSTAVPARRAGATEPGSARSRSVPQRPTGPGRPDATARTVVEGRLRTGDDGCFAVDRRKALIIRGGFNVYPRKVEAVLYGHPFVSEELRVSVRAPGLAPRTRTRARPGSSTPSRRGPPERSPKRRIAVPTPPWHVVRTPPRRGGGRVGGSGMFVKPRIPGT